MAAYGSVISLKNMIQHIQQSSRILLVPPSPQVLQPAYEAMGRLQKVLLKLDDTGYSKIRTKVNDLDDRIKETIWEFEDLLQSRLYDQILPQLESSSSGGERHHLRFSVDLQSLRESVDCFVERVMEMEAEYDTELLNMPEEEGQPISSRIDCGGINSNMVGLSDEFERVRDYLLVEEMAFKLVNWVSVIGMAGVGKTTLAKKVFDDPTIQSHFELRAWVKVGRKCESHEILRCILAQVDHNTHPQMLTQRNADVDADAEILVGLLEDTLKDKKCLIVLDDVWEWDTQLMDNLRKENVRILFTSRLSFEAIPFTSRLSFEAKHSFFEESIRIKMVRSMLGNEISPFQVVRLLNEVESKQLLGEKVFGEKGFPPHLEKLGEKIAKKCEGLPLMIVTVAELLSAEDKTPELEFWTEMAEIKHNSVFVDAYKQISEVIFPSYNYLPQYLKMFFLYLGAFPPYSNIDIQELFGLMSAEGFVESIGEYTLEDFTTMGVVMLARWYHLLLTGDAHTSLTYKLRVHSCCQHMCRKEASKIKFLHVLQSYDDDMKDQRRLGAHCNTLFAFKEMYDSIKSDCASTIRSLLCLGPFHQYPVPIHAIDFKFLWVLHALNVRFYHLPLEILKLVCLKSLALTCNNEVPASISRLFQLQSLIIEQHMNIKKRGCHSYMPAEIWDMQELQYIKITGRDLPSPNSDATLDKLTSLFGVSAKSCTREILQRIPNLRKMKILLELKPYDDEDDEDYWSTQSGLHYISKELQKLEQLSYIVANPELKYEYMVPLQMFPSSLKQLVLSGLGCQWKRMNEIGSLLPNLLFLSLENYAFRGSEWNIEPGCFLKLETLIIKDTDLVQWRAQHGTLPRLRLFSVRHCYKLKQLDWAPDPPARTLTLEVVECNPFVLDSILNFFEFLSEFRHAFSFFEMRSRCCTTWLTGK